MRNRNPLTFFLALIAFVVFAAGSCWLTSQSLILSNALGEGVVAIIFTILLVVGFYVLTSFGSKWVVDSLTMPTMDHRRAWMIGGISVVAVIWLAVSFPTNIHSLLYKRASVPVAKKEIGWLEKELNTISDEDALFERMVSDYSGKKIEIEALQKKLVQEIEHPNRPGIGDSVRLILRRVEKAMNLPTNSILEVHMQLPKAVNHYNEVIDNLKEAWTQKCKKEFLATIPNHEENVEIAKKRAKELQGYVTALDDSKSNKNKVLRSLRGTLDNAYNLVDKYNFFGNAKSREVYIEQEKGMPLARLTNVGEVVYGDYLHRQLSKKYDLPETKKLIYLVFLSLLIDLAAFLFFNIAFGNIGYNNKKSVPKVPKIK